MSHVAKHFPHNEGNFKLRMHMTVALFADLGTRIYDWSLLQCKKKSEAQAVMSISESETSLLSLSTHT